MSNWFVASYYTNTEYLVESEILISSLKKLGIDYRLVKLNDFGDWNRNCQLKPSFIKYMLFMENRPLLYLDVDSKVIKYPSIFDDFKSDVGMFKDKVGTMFFRPTQNSLQILNGWISEIKETPDVWDRDCLTKYIKENNPTGIEQIPVEYCTKFDGSQGNPEEAYIIHYMASRKYGPNRIKPT